MTLPPWTPLADVAAHGQAATVTGLELALIPAGAVLAGAALGILGNGWLDRTRGRHTARRERDQAIAEMLTATADLLSGIQITRGAYDRSLWRARLRTVAAVFTAIGMAFAGEAKVTSSTFLDWRKSTPLIDRLMAIDRWQNEQQRTIGLDLAGVLLPRTSRFFAAVAVLTLGPDKKLADAVKDLTDAATALLEGIAEKDRKYARARSRAEQALGRFGEVADQRQR